MSQRSSGQAGQAGRDWPDDLWPGDDEQSSPAGSAGEGRLVGAAGPQPLPPGGGAGAGPGRAGSLFLIGTVTAVSRTSITVGGPEHTVMAAVTGATRVTGKVSAVTGIKVGDRVSAQITHGGTGNVAVAIADPAQQPADGSLP